MADSPCSKNRYILSSNPYLKYSFSHKPPVLLLKDQVPKWLCDNQFILSGYRPPTNSYTACIHSLFYTHNELGNVLTHLFGAILFIGTLLLSETSTSMHSNQPTKLDKIFLHMMLITTIICMLTSAAYHLFSCHSQDVSKRLQKLDFIGIAVMSTTASITMVHCMFGAFSCAFECAYITLILTLGITACLLLAAPHTKSCENLAGRLGIFVFLAASEVIPIVHSTIAFGWGVTKNTLQVRYLGVAFVLYCVGGVLYVVKAPERFSSGRFDIVLHSHQIFHVLVVVAAGVHYLGVVRAIDWVNTSKL